MERCGRKCTEDERSESEGTFERSENPKGAPGVCERPAAKHGTEGEGYQKLTLLAQNKGREGWPSTEETIDARGRGGFFIILCSFQK